MYPAYLTVDLGYGDSGKGRVVDELVRTTGAMLVVRHSGGPQCGHNVVLPDGRHHCFSQIGSGSFAGALTYYSRFALLEPYALLNEAECLAHKLGKDPLNGFIVEYGTPIITPFHWLANQIREKARGIDRHGSCGMGVGELRSDMENKELVLTVAGIMGDLTNALFTIREQKAYQLAKSGLDPSSLWQESIAKIAADYCRVKARIIAVADGSLQRLAPGPIVFENAQGVMIDQLHGFEPHRTWTDVTFGNAEKLLDGAFLPTKIGIIRTYATRHGAGPFPTERMPGFAEPHNVHGLWQGSFRQGNFDAVATRYALKAVGGVDTLALTHVDRAYKGRIPAVLSYVDRKELDLGTTTEDFFSCRPVIAKEIHYQDLEEILGTKIGLVSDRPSHSLWRSGSASAP